MNVRDVDEFERQLADRLRDRARVESDQVDAMVDFARRLPDRRTPAPRFRIATALVPIAALALALGLVWTASMGPAATSTEQPSISASPSASPAVSASAFPSASIESNGIPSPLPSLDRTRWAADARVATCGGLDYAGTRVLTIVDLTPASDYQKRLPAIGYLDNFNTPDPAVVLVYDGAGPSALGINLNGGTLVDPQAPPAGTYDICIGTAKISGRYLHVPIDWRQLLGERPAPALNVLTVLPNGFGLYGSNLVWDSARNRIWYAYVGCGEKSSLYSLDPQTRKVSNWDIPSNTFGNCDPPQVGLDASGNVWIMENSLLARFVPETARVASVRVAPATWEPSRTQVNASYPTAMAFDGDTAIIARFNTPFITRVTPDMHLSTIPVPAEIAGAAGLAVWDGRLYALSDAGVTVVPLSGLAQSSPGPNATPPAVVVHPGVNPPLTIVSNGGVILWQSLTSGVMVDSSGRTGSAVTPPVPPVYASRASRFTTDWGTRTWYVMGDTRPVIVQVDA